MPDMTDTVALLMLWSQLLTCLLVIGVAGYWLSHYGSAIGSLTGMAGSWVGFTLLVRVVNDKVQPIVARGRADGNRDLQI